MEIYLPYEVYKPKTLLEEKRFARIECADMAGNKIFMGVSDPNQVLCFDIKSRKFTRIAEEDGAIKKISAKAVNGTIYLAYVTTTLKLTLLLLKDDEVMDKNESLFSDIRLENAIPDDLMFFRQDDKLFLILLYRNREYFVAIDLKDVIGTSIKVTPVPARVKTGFEVSNIWCIDNHGIVLSLRGDYVMIRGDQLAKKLALTPREFELTKEFKESIDISPLIRDWREIRTKLDYYGDRYPDSYRIIYVPSNFSGALMEIIIGNESITAWFRSKTPRPLALSTDVKPVCRGRIISVFERGIKKILLLQSSKVILMDISRESPEILPIYFEQMNIRNPIAAFYADDRIYVISHEDIFEINPSLYKQICNLESKISNLIREMQTAKEVSDLTLKASSIFSLAAQLDLLKILHEESPHEILRRAKELKIKDKYFEKLFKEFISEEDMKTLTEEHRNLLKKILDLPKIVINALKESPEKLISRIVATGNILDKALPLSLNYPVFSIALLIVNLLVSYVTKEMKKKSVT